MSMFVWKSLKYFWENGDELSRTINGWLNKSIKSTERVMMSFLSGLSTPKAILSKYNISENNKL